jgi:hypothetical protein
LDAAPPAASVLHGVVAIRRGKVVRHCAIVMGVVLT